MYNISSEFRAELENDNRNYDIRLNITLTDGTQLLIENDQIWTGSVRFEDAVSGDNEFQVGSAIVNKLDVELNNYEDDFSEYDFDDAVVVAYIGINIGGAGSEHIRRGTYIVNESSGYNTSTVKLECYDYMTKLERPYNMVGTTYPATLQSITQDICTHCGVTLQTSTFSNHSYVVAQRPADENLTCRQMMAFVSQIACCFARFDAYGRLTFRWYSDIDYPDHTFDSLFNVTSSLNEIYVTGVRVTEEFAENDNERKEEFLYGEEGYVLDISGNDLIQKGKARDAAEAIGRIAVGMRFYTTSTTVPSDPSVEAGDSAQLTDTKGRTIVFLVTNVTFSPDNSMSVECRAQVPSKTRNTNYTELTRAVVKAREVASSQISQYDIAIQTLTEMMSEAFGVFKTEQTNPDGSVTYILHNKPLLTDSNIQWKMTANGLAVSTDYGQTWNAGIDAQGNAVMNVLNAVGVNADWVRSGKLQVSDSGGNLVFMADLDTRSVYMSGDRVFIGDVSATDAISQLSGALTIALTNESQGIPVDSEGDYAHFPDVSTNIRVVYGGDDVTQLCTLTYSEFNIQGEMVNTGTVYTYTPSSLDSDTGYVAFTASYDTGTDVVQTSKRFNLYKVYAGEPGPAGYTRMYFIESDSDIIKQGADGAYIPSSITFRSFYREGTGIDRTAYMGAWKVEDTTDGVTWNTVESPTDVKTSVTYTPTSQSVAGVRVTLYEPSAIDVTHYGLSAGGTAEVIVDEDGGWFEVAEDFIIVSGGAELDKQSAAVVKDVSALSQDQVFDILTNGGEAQGLYLYNGRVYLNAAYMSTGILKSKDNSTYWNLDTGEILLSPSSKIGNTGEDLSGMRARITTNANTIATEVSQRKSDTSTLSTRITQNANSITAEATERTRQDGLLSASIQANAKEIKLRVTETQAEKIAETTIEANAQSIRLKTTTLTWSATNSSLAANGTFTCKAGSIAGWTIGANSLYKVTTKDGTDYRPIINASSSPTAVAFGVGTKLSSASEYNYPFYVRYDGYLRATNAYIKGELVASSGSIGGFHISSTKNQGTTKNGGHIYTTSLYRHAGDGTYEYEAGIKGDATEGPDTTSSTQLAFYVKRVKEGRTWSDSTVENMFYVTHGGKLYARDATITGAITATSLTLGSAVKIPYSHVSGTEKIVVEDGVIGVTPAAGKTGFVVSKDGLLKASNAVIYGTTYSTAGVIGGWNIASNSIYKILEIGGWQYRPIINAPVSPTLDSIAFGVGYRQGSSGNFSHSFYVTYGGKMVATEATVTGTIRSTSGSIGGWTLDSDAIYRTNKAYKDKNGMYFGVSGLSIKDKFSVGSDGTLNANGAYIGGRLVTSPDASGSYIDVSGPCVQFYYGNNPQVRMVPVTATGGYGFQIAPYHGLGTKFMEFGDVHASNTGIMINYGANPGGYSEAVIVRGQIRSQNTIYCNGSVYAVDFIKSSDERLKNTEQWNENIDPFIMGLKPIQYKWKDAGIDTDTHYGLGAQTVKRMAEEHGLDPSTLVKYSENDKAYGVSYSELAPMMLPSLQENRRRIQALEKQVQELITFKEEVMHGRHNADDRTGDH